MLMNSLFRKKSSRLRIGIGFLALLVMMIPLAGCSGNGNQGGANGSEVVELNLAHFFPGTHPVETELIQSWSAAIEEATEGQIKIVSYPGQTLIEANATYEGVVSGVADIGLSVFSYTRGRFPLLEVFELPGVNYSNSKVASKVAWEAIKELNPEEIQDTKLLMVIATGPGDLLTKVPVRNLEDIQGLELRATGLSAKTLESLGAVPVAMPQSDAYEALSRGVVQGNLSPVEVLKGWRHAEVTDYLTFTPFLYNTLFFITMNLDVWESLSTENQTILESVSEEYFNEVGMGLWDMQNESGLEWAVEETGQELITLSAEEIERWMELVEPIKGEYLDNMTQQGLPGQDALDMVQELAEKYNKELGE